MRAKLRHSQINLELEIGTQENLHMPMFTAALFTIAKGCYLQTTCPLVDKWINKILLYLCT